jgi:hypothetical protein
MKTKALILAAAFIIAGISPALAQVYTVNAVGIVNVSAPPGFSLISNPLFAGAGNNTVAKLFSNVTPGIPPGSKVFIFDNATGLYKIVTFSPDSQSWTPVDDANIEILPGNGVFFLNANNSPVIITFAGEVMQGDLRNPIPAGFSIKANQVPQAIDPSKIGFPGDPNSKLFRFIPSTGSYATYNFIPLLQAWNPALPVIPVGEAFFVYRTTAGSWDHRFFVNE